MGRIQPEFEEIRLKMDERISNQEKKRYPLLNTEEKLRNFLYKHYLQQGDSKDPGAVRLLKIIKKALDDFYLERGVKHKEIIDAAIQSDVPIEGQKSVIDSNDFYRECLSRIQASKNPRWSKG